MSETTGGSDSGPRRGTVFAILLATVIVAALFVSRFVVFELLFFRLAAPALLAAAQLLAAIAVGRGARTIAARLLSVPAGADLSFDLVTGYPLFGSVAFLVGCVSTAVPGQAVVLSLAALAGVAIVLRGTKSIDSEAPVRPTILVLAVVAGAFALLIALLPPTTLDELAYHLTIPKIWALTGRAVDLPLISVSYFPLGTESADLPLFAISLDAAPLASHISHFLMAIATSGLLYSFVKKRGGAGAASVALAAIATTPALVIAAGWSGTDVPLLACCIAIAICGCEDDAAGFSAALAAGLLVKYTFYPFALLAAVAWLAGRGVTRTRLLAIAISGVTGSLFLVRNLVLAHNPFAPFFSGASPGIAGFKSAGGVADTALSYLFDPRFMDDSLGITLVAIVVASPFILFRKSVGRFERLLSAGAILVFVILGVAGAPARLLAPFAAVVALLVFVNFRGTAWERPVIWTIAAGAVIQLLLVLFYISSLDPLGVVSGRIADDEYVRRRPSSALALTGDSMLPSGSRTLVVGLAELFWFSHDVRGAAGFDSDRMANLLHASDPASLRRKLSSAGFTHLLVYPAGILSSAGTGRSVDMQRSTMLPSEEIAMLQQLTGSAPGSTETPILVPLR